MNYEFWKMITNIVQIIGIIGAGLWALRIYVRTRENITHIEFSVDLKFHKVKGDQWITELIGTVENKGRVEQEIKEFFFIVTGICDQDTIPALVEYNDTNPANFVVFPHIIAKGSSVTLNLPSFFILPGVKSSYPIYFYIPKIYEVVKVEVMFFYPNSDYKHQAFIAKVVPERENSNT